MHLTPRPKSLGGSTAFQLTCLQLCSPLPRQTHADCTLSRQALAHGNGGTYVSGLEHQVYDYIMLAGGVLSLCVQACPAKCNSTSQMLPPTGHLRAKLWLLNQACKLMAWSRHSLVRVRQILSSHNQLFGRCIMPVSNSLDCARGCQLVLCKLLRAGLAPS